jgi:hypothetical protein
MEKLLKIGKDDLKGGKQNWNEFREFLIENKILLRGDKLRKSD